MHSVFDREKVLYSFIKHKDGIPSFEIVNGAASKQKPHGRI